MRIKIISRRHVYTGTVITAKNWGSKFRPNWCVVFVDDYIGRKEWKQDRDGGTVQFGRGANELDS